MAVHPERLRKEIITLEEAAWLTIGLLFGWFIGRGVTALIVIIPIIIFLVWVYEYLYAQKYGEKTMMGKSTRRR